MNGTPRILLTPGEPAGVGPDLAVQLAQRERTQAIVAVADPALLDNRAKMLGLPLHLHVLVDAADPPVCEAGSLSVLPVQSGRPTRAGQLDAANAQYVVATLRRAAALCMNGEFQALVTGPVHKGHLVRSGIPFHGHTEFLAALSDTPQPVMMLCTDSLRVALATTHLPLKEVPGRIERQSLERTIRVLESALREQFGLPHPRILVCGLNPHAGDDGALGDEEQTVIAPCLESLRAEGLQLEGPLAADTLFTAQHLETADAVLAMYHDQGLPVLKHLGFGQAVNITLGLPFVRTSVDHGTALEIAGSGNARGDSLEQALRCATELARRTPEQSADATAP